MKKTILGLLSAIVLVAQVNADEVQLRADYPDQHVVVKGDTLWDISNTFLKTPWMWPEIWHVNPQIANPHLIYPGDVVRLIYLDGKPRIVVDSRVVKLSPQMRALDQNEAISTIPLDRINNFLSRSRVVMPGELEAAPHVVSGESQRLLTGKGDRVYARGTFDESIAAYGIYRKGQDYIDPQTGELLGVEAIDIASSRMRALDNDVATLAITRSTQEVRLGDRLIQEEARAIDSNFYPSAPDTEIAGEIVAVEGGISQVGKMSIVVINRGQRENLKVGNILAIYKRGGEVRDSVKGDMVRLPDERAGLVMLFRTFEKLSLGLVLEAERPLTTTDLVRNP
ncbi:MAG: LysM peptidoglycan-binding domain-containing protein [Marinagarivorans sp.]|nr:LysM peptidoglycan-binding domain-containing protein [Marinagarivorans sp.]